MKSQFSNSPTVAVAMSGGVDSSTAAALLLKQGYRVMGVTMEHVEDGDKPASDAAEVCEQLGIKHHVIELQKHFRETVVSAFLEEYLNGRTPNPCVHCNATIKWGVLMQNALEKGAAFFATGHYARVLYDKNSNRYRLLKATYKQKDQSYALWRLNQLQLSKTIFPLGELDKQKVRRLAADLGLKVAHKAESQEICFIPDDDFIYFIKKFAPNSANTKPGEILDAHVKVVGQHRGSAFYTVGQRKGLGLAMGRPVYVTQIDPETNRIHIGDEQDLLASGLTAVQTNWISVEKPQIGLAGEVRIRYKDPGYPAAIDDVSGSKVTIRFKEPRPAVTPGQSAVFYQDDVIIGGGIIASAVK